MMTVSSYWHRYEYYEDIVLQNFRIATNPVDLQYLLDLFTFSLQRYATFDQDREAAGNFLLIYICNFHVLSNLLLIYVCKLHWNLNTMFVCQVNPF